MTNLAAATGHPLATAAAHEVARAGGNAVDAAIAAQAATAVVLPQSAGLGGDGLCLIDTGDSCLAINGTGLSPAAWPDPDFMQVGNHVTVPGVVNGWFEMHKRYGSLPMSDLLAPAQRLCRDGIVVDEHLLKAIDSQRRRIRAVTPDDPVLALRVGDVWRQAAQAELLDSISVSGPQAFYGGAAGQAIIDAVARHGGALTLDDLAGNSPEVGPALSVNWDGGSVSVQPPSSQGVLLAAALDWLDSRFDEFSVHDRDHVLVELTGAIFEWRDDCALGAELLGRDITIDLDHATPRSGPRAYLHTAGVATADADGLIVSSLVSVFDDFGSGIWVPEIGIRLNNRAAGFTKGRNAPRPGARPVHTLAPSLVRSADGSRFALATPGADGQVQTLLQVLASARGGTDLAEAVSEPRWRSQDGHLVIPADHDSVGTLATRNHEVRFADSSSDLYGAVVGAGFRSCELFAVADWRRQTHAGIE